MKKILLSAVAVTCFMSAHSAMGSTRLIVNCFWPPQHEVCANLLPGWLDDIERVTEGRVKGNIPPRSVAPPPEQLASVEKGIADAAVQFNGLIGNRVSGALIAMQPFTGGPNAEIMTQALWETNRKFFPEEFDTVELLSQWVLSPALLLSTTDKPVVTAQDMNGLKLWTLPGPLTAMSSSLGAAAVATPAVQSNEIISRGVVDAHFGLDGDAVGAFQVVPYSKSITHFTQPVYTTTFSFFINKDKWAEISPEDQEAIRSVSGLGFGKAAARYWDESSAAVIATFPDEGIISVSADPSLEQAFRKAAAPITEKWIADATAAGIDAQAALDFYTSRVAELMK